MFEIIHNVRMDDKQVFVGKRHLGSAYNTCTVIMNGTMMLAYSVKSKKTNEPSVYKVYLPELNIFIKNAMIFGRFVVLLLKGNPNMVIKKFQTSPRVITVCRL